MLGGPIDADLSVAYGMPVVRGAAGPDHYGGRAGAPLSERAPALHRRQRESHRRTTRKEADFAADIFEGLGVASSRLLMERQSRNTQENAEFSKAMVAPKPGERWLLVTSAFHMPRSVGLFRKAGFAVEPYPVDWRVGGHDV